VPGPGAKREAAPAHSTVVPRMAVAVLVAMVATAAGLKWRARRVLSRASAVVPAAPVASAPSVPAPLSDDGGPPIAPSAVALPAGSDVARSVRMLHGDARHTGRAAGHAPRAKPGLAWSHDVGGPVEAQIVTSPDQQTLYVASLGGTLTALARADGAARWTVDLGDRAYATPCVAEDGTLYAGSDARKLVALTPDGKTRWILYTDDEADTAPVLASDGTVVFAAGRRVYGVTPLGFVKWRFAARRKVYTSPAVAPDGRVFFGSQDHHVYALTAQGGLMWSVDLGSDVDGAPVLGDDGALYVGTDGAQVVRLDAGDGRVRWRAEVGGYVRGTLSLTRAGDVLAGVYGPAPRQLLLGAADGAVRLKFSVQGTGAREFGVHGGALEDDAGVLLFGAQDDAVYAVGPGGELLWTFSTGGDVDSPITLLDDGSVVLGSDDGKVYMLRGN
jgi:outer membrane protein assembly factor BamB